MAINSRAYQGRPVCDNCGFCSGYGCPIQARVGALAPLREALRAGAELRAGAMVVKVETDGRRATGLSWLDEQEQGSHRDRRHRRARGHSPSRPCGCRSCPDCPILTTSPAASSCSTGSRKDRASSSPNASTTTEGATTPMTSTTSPTRTSPAPEGGEGGRIAVLPRRQVRARRHTAPARRGAQLPGGAASARARESRSGRTSSS